MYGPPGHAYVYFTYGMHHLLNAVTEPPGCPAAVLLRGVEPLVGLELMRRNREPASDRNLTNGPARLCEAFGIDLSSNRVDLTIPPLFIAPPPSPPLEPVQWSPRIGIRNGRKRKWRCFLKNNLFVSRGRPGVAPSRRRSGLG